MKMKEEKINQPGGWTINSNAAHPQQDAYAWDNGHLAVDCPFSGTHPRPGRRQSVLSLKSLHGIGVGVAGTRLYKTCHPNSLPRICLPKTNRPDPVDEAAPAAFH
jgi:hypothetical protein